MWRYVSYPLSMMAGINGIALAMIQGFHHFFGYVMPSDGVSAVICVGGAAGLVAGFIQSYYAGEEASKRNEKELELKDEHAKWARTEQTRQSEWERQEKAKASEYLRQEENAKKKFERDWRLKMEALAGIPNMEQIMVPPPDSDRPELMSVKTGERE